MGRIDQVVQGLAVLDPRWSTAHLAANDAAPENSDYTENSPRPGLATGPANAKAAPQLTGAQAHSVTLTCRESGFGRRDGARWSYALVSDAAERGWNAPTIPEHFSGLDYQTSGGDAGISSATLPTAQEPCVTARGLFYRWDNATGAWTAGVAHTISTTRSVAAVVLPVSERILVISSTETVYSGDRGVTWSPYAAVPPWIDAAAVTYSPDHSTAAVSADGGDLVLWQEEATGEYRQLASNSLGATWAVVQDTQAQGTPSAFWIANQAAVFSMPSGHFGAVYLAGSAAPDPGAIGFRRIGSAFAAFADAAEVVILSSAATYLHVTGYCDAGGSAYCVVVKAGGSTTTTDVYRSDDDGDTWAAMSIGLLDTGRADLRPRSLTATPAQGGVVVAGGFEGGTSSYANNSMWALWCGGWSTIEAPEYSSRLERLAFGDGVGVTANTYLPLTLPSDTGWWANAGAVAPTLPGANARFNTTANDGYVTHDFAAPTLTVGSHVVLCEFAVVAGGDLSSQAAGFGLRWANTATDFEIRVCADTSGFRVYDIHASFVAVAVDMTEGVRIWAEVTGTGTASLHYQARGYRATWIQVLKDAPLVSAGSPAANGSVQFGARAAGTADQRWFAFHVADNTGSAYTGLRSGGAVLGRSLGVLPVPITDAGSATHSASAAVRGGPALVGEVYTVTRSADFPVSAAFPITSPSPSTPYRTASTAADGRIVINCGRASRLDGGSYLVLALRNTNLQKLELRGHDGATWATVATADLRVGTGLSYTLAGDILRPAATTASASRWLQAMELAGGYAVLDPGGTPQPRKILHQTGGAWMTAADLPPTLRLDGIDGTEASTGTCDLVAHSGVLCIPIAAALDFERFAVRWLAADNPASESHYEIGLVFLGALTAYGRHPSRGWSREWSPQTEVVIDAFGTRRSTETGPRRRRWVQSWSDALDISALRATAPEPDVLSAGVAPADATVPLAADRDVQSQLLGILESSLGGVRPVVAISSLPTGAAVTITDPTLWIYGALDGSVAASNVLGDEGSSEVHRIEALTIEELV